MRDRTAILTRWLGVPFADRAFLLALIVATAVPTFLVAAASHWERAAGDDFVQRLVGDEDLVDLGLSVTVESLFAGEDVVASADAAVRSVMSEAQLEAPTRTMSTPRALALDADLAPVGVPVRLISRPGALESLEVVDEQPGATGGVWVSEWFASKFGFAVGESLIMESSLEPDDPGAEAAIGGGPKVELPIVGIYATVWEVDGSAPPDYWRSVTPPGIVPVFIGPFNQPGFALFVTDAATMARSGIVGSVRWDAHVTERPSSMRDLEDLAARLDFVELSLGTAPNVVAALEAQSPGPVDVNAESRVPAILGEARAAADVLSQPIGSTRVAGITIGLVMMVAAGLFLVRRRRTEFRLLAGDGERWPRFAIRTSGQIAVPALIGAGLALLAAGGAAVMVFPGADLDLVGIDWATFLAVMVGGVVAAGLASGIAAQATLDSGRLGPPRSSLWPLVVAGLMLSYLWVQSGRSVTRGAGAIDLTVVALPLVALVTSVLVMIALLDVVRRRVRRFSGADRVGPVLFLSVRRTTAETLGGRMTVGALGVGVGLLVFSWILTATMTRAIEVKSAVEVAGETSIELLTHPPAGVDLPDASTLIAVQTTRISPGDISVTVVAVDPATFANGVVWQDEYGATIDDTLNLLARDVSFGVPAIAVTGQPVPSTGSFGTFEGFPYEVVGRLDAVPFAAPLGVTLLVSADAMDAVEADRTGFESHVHLPDAFSPVRRFRPYLVTTGTADSVEPFITDTDLVVRSVTSRDDVVNSVDAVAARVAFGYLRLLGAIGALAAAASVSLYLAMRRRATALAGVLTRQMGLSSTGSALVTTIEVGLLASLATIAGVAVGPWMTQRLLPRFDPVGELPPDLGVVIPLGAVVATASLIVVIIVAVWIGERLGARKSPMEVLRGAG
jgi:hypothetical protein